MTIVNYPCKVGGALVSFKPTLSPQQKRYIDIAYNILRHMRKTKPKVKGAIAGLLSVVYGATPITMVLISIISDPRGKATPKFDHDLHHYLELCNDVWAFRYYFHRNPKTGYKEPKWKSSEVKVTWAGQTIDLVAYVNQKYPRHKLQWASYQAVRARSVIEDMLQCEYYDYKTPEWYKKANTNRRKKRLPLKARVSAPIRNMRNPYYKPNKY
jgi:hypothetical protein